MLDHPHQNHTIYQQASMLIWVQKINFITQFFLKILFWVLWACLAMQTQSDTIKMNKTLVFICEQRSNFAFHAFLEILQKCANLFFRYFGYAWLHTSKMIISACRILQCLLLHTPKMIVSTCRGVQCLSTSQKYTSSFTFFLRYCVLKNPAVWLADNISFHFRLFPRETNDKIIQKIQKMEPFWVLFPQIYAKMNFPGKKGLPVYRYFNYLPLCQK